MCLSKNNRVTKPRIKSGYGYKVFRRYGGELYSLCYDDQTPRPRGKWLQASKGILYGDSPNDEGWHVYLRKADALGESRMMDSKSLPGSELRVLVRVRYRGAFARGLGDGGWNMKAQIVVADEIYIL
jgi:hypothetical protein